MTADEALGELLRTIKNSGYRFIAITPETHAKVLARSSSEAIDLRDIFGWNRPFGSSDLSPTLLGLLKAADAIEHRDGRLRSKVRVASLGEDLLLHSAFPTDESDAVFFGPDTYRFARFIEQHLPDLGERGWLVDMGAGSGAGAIAAARVHGFSRITMVDVNAAALRLASINAAAAGVPAQTVRSDAVPAGADLLIANPPYMADSARRSYRDGGNLYGGAVALDWVRQALERLAPGGTMLLYTGAAFIDGQSPLLEQIESACAVAAASLDCSEIDPDVFGSELDQPPYEKVERIAAIGAIIKVSG